MIVPCPNCGKQIASAAPVCSHCGFSRGAVSDEQLKEFKRRQLRDRIYHLNMTSYTVIAVFLGAFGWHWWDTIGFQEQASVGPTMLLAAGTVAYLFIRVLLFRAKRELKKFR